MTRCNGRSGMWRAASVLIGAFALAAPGAESAEPTDPATRRSDDTRSTPKVEAWVVAEIVAVTDEHLTLVRERGLEGPVQTQTPFVAEIPADLLVELIGAGLEVHVQERFLQAEIVRDEASLDVSGGAASASAGAPAACDTNVYGFADNNGSGVAIPDDPDSCNSGQAGYARLSVAVPDAPGSVVCKVQYRTRVQHTYPGDLVVQLNNDYHALEDGFPVWQRNGGTDDGGFDDDLASNENIYFDWRETSQFNGDPVGGLWHIDVWDYCPTEVGTIKFAEFRIYYGNPELRLEPLFLVLDCQDNVAAVSSVASSEVRSDDDVMPVPRERKLVDPEKVAAPLRAGQRTTDVIVTLEQPVQLRRGTDFNNAASVNTLQAGVAQLQNQVLSRIAKADVHVGYRYANLAGFSASVTAAGLEKLLNDPLVRHVEPDRILQPLTSEGIPLMHAMATRSTYDGSGTAVAIVDSGVDYTHARLGGGSFPNAKVKGGYDFGDNDADPMPSGVAHGTCCAGIAAGKLGTAGNFIGGVAPGAKLYALKISAGTGGSARASASVAAWDWCVTHKNDSPAHPIVAISYSYGGGYYTTACDDISPAMTIAAQNANNAGITVLAASGNDGDCDGMAYPACITPVISVGAVYDADVGNHTWCTESDSCISYSCSGCSTRWCADDSSSAADQVTAYSNSASFLDIFAPSNDALTTDIVGSAGYDSGNYTSTFGGTSAACPYAAGAVAALQSAAKERTGSFLSPEQVRTALVSTGDPITDPKANITKPRVNLEAAIDTIACDGWYLSIHNDGNVFATVDTVTGVPSWASLNPPPPYTVPAGDSVSICVTQSCNACAGADQTATLDIGSDSILLVLDCEEWGACCAPGAHAELAPSSSLNSEGLDASAAPICNIAGVRDCRSSGGSWWGPRTDCGDFACPNCDAAFVHITTAYDASFNYTIIDHPVTNGNPDAILLVTPVYDPVGRNGRYHNVPVGVWYSTPAGKWGIFNEDLSEMPIGVAFNVEVFERSSMAFTHVATEANIVADRTILDHPLTNGHRNHTVMVTRNWSAGSSIYNPSPVGVHFTNGTWRIFNQDRADMPLGAGFNVVVLPPLAPSAFIHTATADSIVNEMTIIDHPLTNDVPGSVLEVTQNRTASGGTFNERPVGVRYNPDGHWTVFNEDQAAMVENLAFNVSVASECDAHDMPRACCFMDAGCLDLPPDMCPLFGGVPQTAGTCDDTSCQVLGACCQSGACVGEYKAESACVLNGRTWHAQETCSTVVCPDPPPTGACCATPPDQGAGTCSVVTEADCADLGGNYLGDGASCAGDPCQPFGACCAGVTCESGYVCGSGPPQWCDGSFDCGCADTHGGGTVCLKFTPNCGPPCDNGTCAGGLVCVDLCFCGVPVCMEPCPAAASPEGGPVSAAVSDTKAAPIGDDTPAVALATSCREMRQDECEAQGGLFHGDQSLCANVVCQECFINADCDDGKYCNGAETCVRGACRPGKPPDCDDGVACTQDGCNESTDQCVHVPRHARCDDGLFCNGNEGCHATLGCMSGPPPDCGDGLACTLDACDEQNDTCTHTPKDRRCNNGVFCDGHETCDPVLGCQPGTPPDCGDGLGCTQDACSEADKACVHTPRDGRCDNGLFCDGLETCHPMLGCQPGSPPDCDDGVDCTIDGCDEDNDTCAHAPSDDLCDNGLYCDGAEWCHRAQGCRIGPLPDCSDGEVCTEDTCDETLQQCLHAPLPDCDRDTVCDADDNCPTTPNADQSNTDGDAHGDACDGWFDFDHDGDVDYVDLASFTECMSRQAGSPSPECLEVSDVVGDGHVDLRDAASLLASWSGVVTQPCDAP